MPNEEKEQTVADTPDIAETLARRDAQDRERQRIRERDQVRLDVTHQVDLATTKASAVGMPLGMWAGRGDWAKFSEESREKAGQRALTELDQAIKDLAEARRRLAETLTEQSSPPTTDSSPAEDGQAVLPHPDQG